MKPQLIPVECEAAGSAAGSGYSGRLWQAHVLANLPFYCVLVPVFAEVTLIRIRANGDSSAANCLKVSRQRDA